jgi:hypothetical protein
MGKSDGDLPSIYEAHHQKTSPLWTQCLSANALRKEILSTIRSDLIAVVQIVATFVTKSRILIRSAFSGFHDLWSAIRGIISSVTPHHTTIGLRV